MLASKRLFQRLSFGDTDGAWEPAFHRQMGMLESPGHTLRSASSGVRSLLSVLPVMSRCLFCSQVLGAAGTQRSLSTGVLFMQSDLYN